MAEEYSMSPRRLNNKTRLEFRCFRETLSQKNKKKLFRCLRILVCMAVKGEKNELPKSNINYFMQFSQYNIYYSYTTRNEISGEQWQQAMEI